MPAWVRKVALAAIAALGVGLCVNVFGISVTDPTFIQAVGMVAVFIALAV